MKHYIYKLLITEEICYLFTVYHMKSTGWVHISDQDCKDLHYVYAKEKIPDEN
jgi:hypothetical protein